MAGVGLWRDPGHPSPLVPCSLFPASLASQVLYQGLEKLEKEKANREHLEMEIDVVRTRPGGVSLPGSLLAILQKARSGG